MKLIKEEKIDRELKDKEFVFKFEIEKECLYGIEILASAKSWWQNFLKLRAFFKDDDLTLKIDNISFPKKSNKKGLFDGEVAWNGNNLKGLKKTNFFLVYLQEGAHNLNFLVDRAPFLETIRIYQIEESEISFLPKDNLPSQDGNQRQWLTIVLVNIGLDSLKIRALAKEGKKFLTFQKDDSDLKLIINGKVQINEESKSHNSWYWCGKTLKGKSKEFNKELNLSSGLHYFELWVDRSPDVEEIKITLEKTLFLTKAKVVWQKTYLRKDPTINEKNILVELSKDEKVPILKRAKKGERPIYQSGKPAISNIWHEVVYKEKTGFIFSEAIEIEGEDKETIKEKIIQKSKELSEDECLMLAVPERESEFFPYAVSEVGAKGIFQLKEDAFSDVNKKFGKDFSDRFDIEQNIEGGILYFQLIKEKYQGKDYFWERCLAAWNRGWGKVPADKPFEFEKQPIETRQFIQDVLKLWDQCKKNRGKILFPVIIFGLFLGLFIFFSNLVLPFNGSSTKPTLPSDYKNWTILATQNINRDNKQEKLIAIIDKPNSTFSTSKIILMPEENVFSFLMFWQRDRKFIEVPGEGGKFLEWEIGDFNKNGKIELAVTYDNYGSAGFHTSYLYEWRNSNFKILFSKEKIGSQLEFKDLDNDEIEEILHKFYLDKWVEYWVEIYKWNNNQQDYVKTNNLFPEIYKQWLKERESNLYTLVASFDVPSPKYFENPILKKEERINQCLIEKANLNSQGIFADVNDCYE